VTMPLCLGLDVMVLGAHLCFGAPSPAPVVIDGYCDKTVAITWSKHDTLETQQQIKQHNYVYHSLCTTKKP